MLKINPFLVKHEGARRISLIACAAAYLLWLVFILTDSSKSFANPSQELGRFTEQLFGVFVLVPVVAYVGALLLSKASIALFKWAMALFNWVLQGFIPKEANTGHDNHDKSCSSSTTERP